MFAPFSALIWFLCAVTFFPDGAMGVALKLNVPKTCSCADNLGFVLDVSNRFMVIYA